MTVRPALRVLADGIRDHAQDDGGMNAGDVMLAAAMAMEEVYGAEAAASIAYTIADYYACRVKPVWMGE